ncbi:amidohydrolase family protein [Aureimonas flava]|nr:amidohydrolase family protein [Aureimonas flava]
MVFEKGQIAALLPADAVVPDQADERIDGRRLLAVPGFVNAHTHSPYNLVRGSAPMLPLELWSLHASAGSERRTAREVEVSALLGAVEMLRTGTTTVLDHIRIAPDIEGDLLDATAEAYRHAGMRAVIAPVVADKPLLETLPLDSADFGGEEVAGYAARPTLPARRQVEIVEAFAARWRDDPLVSVGIGPSGPQRCTPELLVMAEDFARRHETIAHMHVLETRAQAEMGRRLHPGGMLAYLDDLGVLSSRSNLVHANWLAKGDVERIAQRDAAVIHNPVSNVRLASGRCPLPRLLRSGIRVGLGTDGACCNDSGNMLETLKWAAILHNDEAEDPARWIQPGTALRLACEGGADAIGLGKVAGRLDAGMAADVCLLDLDTTAFVPLSDPVRQLVLSETGGAVRHVFVDGRAVLRDGRCTSVDEPSLFAEAQELSDRRRRDNQDVYAAASRLDGPIRRMRRRLLSSCEIAA